jgi:hypothetical protein
LGCLDDLIRMMLDLGDGRYAHGGYLCLETVDFQAEEATTPVRLDPIFWPTLGLQIGPDGRPKCLSLDELSRSSCIE